MKKILSFLICLTLFNAVAFATPVVYEKPDVKIIVEGNELSLEQEVPIIINSRTLVPLRKLLVGLGVPDNNENIQWIGEKKQVKVDYNGVNISLSIDNTKAYVNGKEYVLDSAPVIHRSRTYLPARFVGEALGYSISWDSYTPAVLVTSNTNMSKLTNILNDLNAAMDRVSSYEVSTMRTTDVTTTYNGVKEKSEYSSVALERADLANQIVYNEATYKDEFENNVNFSYSTPEALYNCYKYVEDGKIYTTGWERYQRTSASEKSPFESKEKLGIVRIDKALYGSLVCKEYKDAYEISTVSDQIDILKSLDGQKIYDEVKENGRVSGLSYKLAISKDTKLPISLEIHFVVENNDVNNGVNTLENNDYLIDFSEYNGYLKLELPRV